MIPYGRQHIYQEDIDSVVDVLRSDFLTQGPMVPAFEQAVATRVKACHAVAVNSATSALHIACLALGLKPGDTLWTVPNSFPASANCGLYCGARVDFVDIDPATCNLSIPALEAKLDFARRHDCLPKIVVPVHFAGQPVEQEKIWQLSQQYGFAILEDASHAIGSSRHGEPVGSCRWSHITVFSFHPVKIITTGEGGMATTNDDTLAQAMRLLRSHGITRDSTLFRGQTAAQAGQSSPWYYEQLCLGFNYRMTDMEAALGVSQIKRLDHFVQRRNDISNVYSEQLADLPVRLPHVAQENVSAFHLYSIHLTTTCKDEYARIFNALRQDGIGVNLHYMPIHLHPFYRELGFSEGMFPNAEKHASTELSLPIFPKMSQEEQLHVITMLNKHIMR